MERLPAGYGRTIASGIEALSWAAAVLEQRHEATGDDRVLLSIREVTGLVDRLKSATPEEWEAGRMMTYLSPQDLGVLGDWVEQSPGLPGSAGRARQFEALRRLLGAYIEGG